MSTSKEKWRMINKLINKQKQTASTNIDPREFQEHFRDHFSSSHTNFINAPLKQYIPDSAVIFPANCYEIFGYFQSLKNKFSCVSQDIPMFLWKKIAHVVCIPVTYLINQMFSTAVFPSIFKTAEITPVFKKGDRNEIKNYRPVTCLHNLSKIFEKAILSRINSFCSKHNILPSHQFGFRAGHSTKDAILSLFLKVEQNILQNKRSCCIFLDLSSAFDKVVHCQLLNILETLGFRGHFNSLLQSFLFNRQFCIKAPNQLTTFSPIEIGVPQGSILSPMLYCLYVHNFSSVHPDVIQYADDSTIIVSFESFEELDKKLDCVGKNLFYYLNTLNLKLNISKTEIVIFGDKSTKNIRFMNSNIQTANLTKFLGISISSCRTFNHHIQHVIVPSIKRHYSFFLHCSSFFSKQNRITIFKAFIQSHIIYAIPFINIANKESITLLKRAYNRAIKCLFHLPFMLASDILPQRTSIPSLSNVLLEHTNRYAYLIFNRKTPVLTHCHFSTTRRGNFILKSHKDKKSLHNSLAEHWNTLPSGTKSISSKSSFKHALHKFN